MPPTVAAIVKFTIVVRIRDAQNAESVLSSSDKSVAAGPRRKSVLM
jgi:hypothetical protein